LQREITDTRKSPQQVGAGDKPEKGVNLGACGNRGGASTECQEPQRRRGDLERDLDFDLGREVISNARAKELHGLGRESLAGEQEASSTVAESEKIK
jgi:hypothetical protein